MSFMMLTTPLFAFAQPKTHQNTPDVYFAHEFNDSPECTTYLMQQMTDIDNSCYKQCSRTCISAFQNIVSSIAILPKACKSVSSKESRGTADKSQAIVSSILYANSLNFVACKKNTTRAQAPSKSNATNEVNAIIVNQLISKKVKWSKVLASSTLESELQMSKWLAKMEFRFGENGAKSRLLAVSAKFNVKYLTNFYDSSIVPKDVYSSFFLDNSFSSLDSVSASLDRFATKSTFSAKNKPGSNSTSNGGISELDANGGDDSSISVSAGDSTEISTKNMAVGSTIEKSLPKQAHPMMDAPLSSEA